MIAPFDATNRDRAASWFARGGHQNTVLWNSVLLAIVALLVTVAVLQYRWIKQIHDDMQERARSSMEIAMTQWSREFYRGLYSICGGLLADPDEASQEGWNDYLQRYATWRHEEYHYNPVNTLRPYTSLVSKVYIWETANGGAPKLLLLDPVKNKIEPAPVPENLQPLLARLRERSHSYAAALDAWELPGQSSSAPAANQSAVPSPQQRPEYTGWQFDQTIPALVHPVVHNAQPMTHASVPPPVQGPVDWMVVLLNRQAIQNSILPQLAKRNFSGRYGLEYKVAVVAPGLTPSVIYSSDLGFPQAGSRDATMSVFGRPDNTAGATGPVNPGSPGRLTHDDSSHLSGPGWQWFPVIQYGSGTAPWTLVVKQRSGYIDATVNRVWRTNVFTSLAVLLLLAGSVSVLVVATRRAQYLAQLQMNFVTGVSHELRTPLAVMLSAAENITDGIVENPAEVREHGRIIVGQARVLSDLVNRILLFAAGSLASVVGPREAVDVADAINQVLFNLSEPIRSAGITVDLNIPSALPRVFADPVSLGHCLQNLVVNAIKYRGQSKWITISAEVSDLENSDRGVKICVQDRGIGIHESELKSIFEPFYRSSDVVARQIQGTGLGLAVVKRSILEMGGQLMVASEFGSGSAFTIILPVVALLAERAPAPTPKDTKAQVA